MLKLVDFPGMEESFMVWGYSKTTMYIIGIVELILAVTAFIPQTRFYALLGIGMLMLGAIYTHYVNFEYGEMNSAIFILFLSISSIILGFLQKKTFKK